MRLRPRQYVYIAVIVALAIYNFVRIQRIRRAASQSVPLAVQSAPGTSPAWKIYDKAASLRDASDAEFSPALRTLTQSLDDSNGVAVPPQTSPSELADLRGCRTWLLFYRQEVLHPSVNKPGWREQTLQHTLSCAKEHRDTAK